MGRGCAAGATAAALTGRGSEWFSACSGVEASTNKEFPGRRGSRSAFGGGAISVPPQLSSACPSCWGSHTRTPISSSIARCRAPSRNDDSARALMPAPAALPGTRHLLVAIPILHSWTDCLKQITTPAKAIFESLRKKMLAARLCDNCFSLQRMDNVCGCNLVAYLPSFIAGHTATHSASGLRHPQDPFMRARHVCCCLRRQTVDVFSPSGALSMRQAVAHLRKLALPHPSPSCIQKASDPP